MTLKQRTEAEKQSRWRTKLRSSEKRFQRGAHRLLIIPRVKQLKLENNERRRCGLIATEKKGVSTLEMRGNKTREANRRSARAWKDGVRPGDGDGRYGVLSADKQRDAGDKSVA